MIHRRDWLLVVGGGLLAACTAPVDDEPKPAQPQSESQLQPFDPKKVLAGPLRLKVTAEGKKIGRTYSRKTPTEAHADALRAALPRGLVALKAQVVSDYARDDVVVLRGWVLARTEARLLALGAAQGGTATL